ncbi:MAG: hypothetical protein ACM359_03670 [Bacillota bacterium]
MSASLDRVTQSLRELRQHATMAAESWKGLLETLTGLPDSGLTELLASDQGAEHLVALDAALIAVGELGATLRATQLYLERRKQLASLSPN